MSSVRICAGSGERDLDQVDLAVLVAEAVEHGASNTHLPFVIEILNPTPMMRRWTSTQPPSSQPPAPRITPWRGSSPTTPPAIEFEHPGDRLSG